ncbi:stAR-related lipid transfer protein 6 [Bufo gargarizans]|uniref:stAR-related lipid transfer protein 6 n=1 Tax=Bufo gargarizans TaxID=30331 RepID=UPI001CF4F80F|nr:stAR-related lipid transfer protein 6 [Bufo gargarizans]XP_044150754.1 stAR-related lipid transfer protein 6 [Bufo gargarizans]
MDYKKIADDVSQTIRSYSQDTSGWKVAKSTKNITISWKPSNEYPGNIYRGEGIIEGVPEKVIPFMYLAKYRSKWDSALKSYSIVEEVDEDTFICHCITHSHGMGLISPREFVDLIHIRRYDGGVVTTNSISVEYDKCPVSSSPVRGFNNPCGYVCSPLPENPAHSRLEVFIQPNLGGLLPRSVVETALPSNVVGLINDAREGIKTLLQG